MVKVLVLLMLIVPSFYNFIVQRNNKIRVKKSNLGFTLAIFASITSIFWYRLDRGLMGFMILLSAILLVYTLGFLPGIGTDGISVFMWSTPILKFISFDQIKDVSLVENYNDIKLSINAFGDTYKQLYEMKDRDEIIKFLDKNRLIKGDIDVR